MLPDKSDSSGSVDNSTSNESSMILSGKFGTYVSRVQIPSHQEPSLVGGRRAQIVDHCSQLVISRHEPAESTKDSFGKVVRFRSKDFVIKYNKTVVEGSVEVLRDILNRIVDTIDFGVSQKVERDNIDDNILAILPSLPSDSPDVSNNTSINSVLDFRAENIYRMPFKPRKSVLRKLESQFSLRTKLTEDDFFTLRNLFLFQPKSLQKLTDIQRILQLRTPPNFAEVKLMEKEFKRIVLPQQKDLDKLDKIFTIHCGPSDKQLLHLKKKFKFSHAPTVDDFFEMRYLLKKARKFNGVHIVELQRYLKVKLFTHSDLLDLQNYLTISFKPSDKQVKYLNSFFVLPNPATEADYFRLRNIFKDPCKPSEKPLIDFYLSLLPCQFSSTQVQDLKRLMQNEGGLLNLSLLNSKHNQSFIEIARDYCKLDNKPKPSFLQKVYQFLWHPQDQDEDNQNTGQTSRLLADSKLPSSILWGNCLQRIHSKWSFSRPLLPPKLPSLVQKNYLSFLTKTGSVEHGFEEKPKVINPQNPDNIPRITKALRSFSTEVQTQLNNSNCTSTNSECSRKRCETCGQVLDNSIDLVKLCGSLKEILGPNKCPPSVPSLHTRKNVPTARIEPSVRTANYSSSSIPVVKRHFKNHNNSEDIKVNINVTQLELHVPINDANMSTDADAHRSLLRNINAMITSVQKLLSLQSVKSQKRHRARKYAIDLDPKIQVNDFRKGQYSSFPNWMQRRQYCSLLELDKSLMKCSLKCPWFNLFNNFFIRSFVAVKGSFGRF